MDGTLSQSSDRNKKQAFRDGDQSEILDAVNRLAIQSWQYQDDPDGIRHVGPVSQDFYREFGMGKDNFTIATVDADGVALAAIQALSARLDDIVREKDKRIDELQDRVTKLEALLENR